MTIDNLSMGQTPQHQTVNNYATQSRFVYSNPRYYNTSITISHWQLKDLLCKSSTSNEILYPSGDALMSLNLDNNNNYSDQTAISNQKKLHNYQQGLRRCSLVAKFESSPRCFKELDGISVAGGVLTSGGQLGSWKGLFGIHIKGTGYTQSCTVGSLINNSVSIYKRNESNYFSLLCNNDQNLYIVDLANYGVSHTSSVNIGFPLNHSSLSPDTKSIVIAGDSSKIFMLHPEENMNDYSKTEEICTPYDSGFSTNWHNSGLFFSVCFQEGVNLVYDVRRSDKPINTIFSTRRGNQYGAFRVCKFSEGTDDLLFISEHNGRVHMVDTRDYSNHQVILLPNMPASEFHPITENGSLDNDSHLKNNHNEQNVLYQPLVRPYHEVISEYSHASSLSLSSPSSTSNQTQMNYPYGPNFYQSRTGFVPRTVRLSGQNRSSMGFDQRGTVPLSLRQPDQEHQQQPFLNPRHVIQEASNSASSRIRVIRRRLPARQSDSSNSANTDTNTSNNTNISNQNNMNNNMNLNTSISSNDSEGKHQYINSWTDTLETDNCDVYKNGDIEISGLEWMENENGSSLFVGCDKGILEWRINSWKRRCFPSFLLS